MKSSQSKIVQLILIVQLIYQSLSETVTQSTTTTNIGSILMVNYTYTCPNSSSIYNPIDGLQTILNTLTNDYNSTTANILNNPHIVILTLKLTGTNSICYITKDQHIYNPFILGQVNTTYQTDRKKKDSNCCYSLQNTYDLQVIIQHSDENSRLQISPSIDKNTLQFIRYFHLHWFPNIRFKNIELKQEYHFHHYNPIFRIDGYEFGKDIDISPIAQRIQRFRYSQLVFDNFSLATNIDGAIQINSTYNYLDFKTTTMQNNFGSTNLVLITCQRDQIEYLAHQSNKITGQSVYQMYYNFTGLTFLPKKVNQGCMFNLTLDTLENQDPSFQIKLVLNNWNLTNAFTHKHTYAHSNLTYTYTFKSQLSTKIFVAEMEGLNVHYSTLEIPLLQTYNLSKFHNIVVNKNTFDESINFVHANIIRSQNVSIINNHFKYRFSLLNIIQPIESNKSQALKSNSKSQLKNWNISSNKASVQRADNPQIYKSLIYYKVERPSSANDLYSKIKSEIEQLKSNLGFTVDNLTVQSNTCSDIRSSLSTYQYLKIVNVIQAFHFRLHNSSFTSNEYHSSNNLENVSYIDIDNIHIQSNSVPQSILKAKTETEFAFLQIYHIPYFFNISGFHEIQIQNISINHTILEQSLFKITDQNQQLEQTIINGNRQILNVKNISLVDEIYLKPGVQYGAGLFYVATVNPTEFTFQKMYIKQLNMYQQMYYGDDMAVIVYFNSSKSQKSQFRAIDLDILNNTFQYRKGLFDIQACKVIFENIRFKNNQYQIDKNIQGIKNGKYSIRFEKIESKGCIMNVQAQKLDINNITVDNSTSKEATILKMIADPPTNISYLGLDGNNNELDILKVHNSTFTNIISYEESILFSIDLVRLVYSSKFSSMLRFDKLKVENAFSFKSGALFRIHAMDGQKINISNSDFRYFKSGSGEQFIYYMDMYSHRYQQDIKVYKLMFKNIGDYVQKHIIKRSELIIQNCTIDNLGVINRFISSLQYLDIYRSKDFTTYWNKNREILNRLMKYTNKSGKADLDSSVITFLKSVEQSNKFKGGQLITNQNSTLLIKDSFIRNIETLQQGGTDYFPLVLKSMHGSEAKIENTIFSNLGPNQRGMFEIEDSKFSLEGCQLSQIYDLHYDGASFDKQVNRNKQFNPDKNDYSVYNVFNNDKYMVGSNLESFKGGLLAYNSIIAINNNIFQNIRCKQCTGLVLSIKSSLIQVRNNEFKDINGSQASCIYIEGKQTVNGSLVDVLEKKGDKYTVKNPTIEISNNNFTNNNASGNSSCIYMKQIQSIVIKNNKFENNRAKYGTCLYSTEQNNSLQQQQGQSNGFGIQIVTDSNQFVNNMAYNVGQIYYKDIFVYNMGSNTFRNNSAGQFSTKVFSYPYSFKLDSRSLNGNDGIVQNEYVLNNYPSNHQKMKVEFVFYDQMGEKVNLSQYIGSKDEFASAVYVKNIDTYFDDSFTKTNYQRSSPKLLNQQNFNDSNLIKVNSTWINDNLQIIASPMSKTVIEFGSAQVIRSDENKNKFVSGYTFRLVINFRGCKPGEYYDKEQNYCQKCLVNTYSFSIDNKCKRQQDVFLMDEAYGGTKTSVVQGAWRSITNTDKIIACENIADCQPDLQRFPNASILSGNYLCRTGHVGPLCQSCDNYGEFWGQSYQYSVKDKICVACSNSNWTIVFFFIFLLGIVLFAAYTVNKQVVTGQDNAIRQKLKNIRQLLIAKSHRFLLAHQRVFANKAYCNLNRHEDNDHQQSSKKYPMKLKYKERDDGYSYEVYTQKGDEKIKNQMNILQVDFNEIIQPTALIKILVTYLMILSIAFQSTKKEFKGIMEQQQAITNIAQPVKQAMYSTECLIIGLGLKSVPVYMVKDIIITLGPLLNWLVFILVWKVLLRSKLDKPVILNSLSFIVYCHYPQIISNIFPAVIPQQYDGVDYVQSDPKYIYQSQKQLYLRVFFYIPVLVSLLILLPVLFILFLKKNKKKLYEADFKMIFGFIYQEYRNKCYYIEFIKIGVKVLIMMIQNIFIDSLELQILIIQQILTVYLVVMIIVRPYSQHSANAIEMYNIILCLLNMILVNSIYWSQKIDSKITTFIFVVFFLVTNLAFIVVFIKFFFKQMITKITQQIFQLKYILLMKFPKLRKFRIFNSANIHSSQLNTRYIWQKYFKEIKIRKFQVHSQDQSYQQNIDDAEQKYQLSEMSDIYELDDVNECISGQNDPFGNQSIVHNRIIMCNIQKNRFDGQPSTMNYATDNLIIYTNQSNHDIPFIQNQNRQVDLQNSLSNNQINLNQNTQLSNLISSNLGSKNHQGN